MYCVLTMCLCECVCAWEVQWGEAQSFCLRSMRSLFESMKRTPLFVSCLQVTANHTDFQRRPDYGKELKLAKSLALVLFLFTVSWLPLHVLNCVTLFCPSCVPKSYLYGPILLTHVNSAVNPVVYAFHINKFRTAFRKIWKNIPQNILCRDPVGRLPQKGSQRGWTHKGRLRQNCDDRDGL